MCYSIAASVKSRDIWFFLLYVVQPFVGKDYLNYLEERKKQTLLEQK